jgi:hypothetical protein
MTFWRNLKTMTTPVAEQPSVKIEQGILYYYRHNGALSCCEIDHLQSAWLRTIRGEIYWHLIDQTGAFVLLPESTPGLGLVRRYLSSWRGFNYNGLCRYEPASDHVLQLWPLLMSKAA